MPFIHLLYCWLKIEVVWLSLFAGRRPETLRSDSRDTVGCESAVNSLRNVVFAISEARGMTVGKIKPRPRRCVSEPRTLGVFIFWVVVEQLPQHGIFFLNLRFVVVGAQLHVNRRWVRHVYYYDTRDFRFHHVFPGWSFISVVVHQGSQRMLQSLRLTAQL